MKKVILGTLLLPLVLLFTVFSVQGQKVSATEHADVITRMYFTDCNGNVLTPPNIEQWEKFRINADFSLHNNEVKAGDTTVIQLPEVVTTISDAKFDLLDDKGNVVAKAVVDNQTKKVTITYEPYVETHSDVKGTFFFYVQVNHDVVTTKTEVPVDITVNGKIVPAGKLHFQGIKDPVKDDINKVGWADSSNPTIGRYSIAINRIGRAMTGVTVVDILENPQIIYKQETFRVQKGEWAYRNGDWTLDNAVDITQQVSVTFEEGRFTVKLPDLSADEGIQISYSVQLPYTPTEGDRVSNSATLTTADGTEVTRQSRYTLYQGGGQAEGHVFGIQIKKVSEDGTALKGAKFDVIRDRTGQVVAQVETDENGMAQVGNLLKDTYTLKETQAPAGYHLADDVKVTPADFDATSKIALKTIVDKKRINNESTPTIAVISVTKKLTGRPLQDGEFEFTLTDASGKVVDTAKNKADGQVNFKDLSFNKEGTYTYTVREVAGDAEGVTYDKKVVTATVTVEKNQAGQLAASVRYDSEDLTFTNSYVPPTEPNVPSELTTPPSAGQKRVLPKTGSQTNLFLVVTGLILGSFSFFLKKKAY